MKNENVSNINTDSDFVSFVSELVNNGNNNNHEQYPPPHIKKTIEELIANHSASASVSVCNSSCDLAYACPILEHYIRDRNEESVQRGTQLEQETHIFFFQSTDVIEQQMDNIHLKLFTHRHPKQAMAMQPKNKVNFSFFLCVFIGKISKKKHSPKKDRFLLF
jgi:hypothetical protein